MADRLTAQELCEYDDDQLGRYLEENGRIVKVADPQNLPQSFIQRLRDWCDPEKQPGAAASQPVDMNQVNAKLMRVMDTAQPGFTPSPSPDTPMGYEVRVEYYTRKEEDAYDKLLDDGGQPLYDHSLIRAVCQEPYEYKDLLAPFTDPAKNPAFDWYCALRMQWESWKRFRWTQKIKRKTDTKLEAHNKLAAENRIELGITGDFVFIMDTDKQDKLTTWMEYLQYECSAYIRQGYPVKRALKYKSDGASLVNWVVEQIPAVTKDSATGAINNDADGNMVETASSTPKEEPARSRIASPSFEDVVERNLEDERRAYEELVVKGGRPLHPIEELRAIAEDPDAYSDLLRPFPLQQGASGTEWWCKYGAQLASWDKFHAHRGRARGSEDTLDTFNKKAATTRALVGVTIPVVFLMDMDKQDKLTTWMEYLQHECDYYERWYESLKYYKKHRHWPTLATVNWIIEQIPFVEMLQQETDNNTQPENNAAQIAFAGEVAQESLQHAPASRKRREDDGDTAPIQQNSEALEPTPKRSRKEKASTYSAVSTPAVSLPPPTRRASASQQAVPRRSARLAAKAAQEIAETIATAAKPPARTKAKAIPREKRGLKARTKAKSEPEEKPTRSLRRQAISKPQKTTSAKSKKRG